MLLVVTPFNCIKLRLLSTWLGTCLLTLYSIDSVVTYSYFARLPRENLYDLAVVTSHPLSIVQLVNQ